MPRPRVDDFWKERVKELAAQERLSALAIEQIIVKERKRMGITTQPPSARTIGRWLSEFRKSHPAEQWPYRRFSWPQSMMDSESTIPWEASRACLDFLCWWNGEGREGYDAAPDAPWDRPTNRMALWFWRVTQAAPTAPIGVRFSLLRYFAGEIAELDGSLPRSSWLGIETCLAFRPWESEFQSEQYNAAVYRGFAAPYPRFFPGQPVPFEQWLQPYGPGWPRRAGERMTNPETRKRGKR